MIKTKYFSSSSIPISFASVFLFSTLFAACCFTFLYLQPLHDDHGSDERVRNIHNLLNSPTISSGNRKTKIVEPPVAVDPIASPNFQVENLVSADSMEGLKDDQDGGGLVEEPATLGNSTSDSTASPTQDVDSSASIKVEREGTDNGGDEQKLVNSTAVAMNSTSMAVEEQGIIQQEVESNASSNSSTGAIPMAVNDGNNNTTSTSISTSTSTSTSTSALVVNEEEEEEKGQDSESTQDLYSPPFNVSAEERMAWFKKRVPGMKIFESTKKTRAFEQRIHNFFEGCKVKVFLVWISPSSLFGKREMFSLESVLKAHPNGCVVIVSRTMDSKPGRAMLKPLVDLGRKVLPIAPDLSLLFSNTPAEPWLAGLKAGEFDPGMIPITQNLSNLIRLILLYKYGGIYLDVDVIVLKDISKLKNTVGIQTVDTPSQTWTSLNNAVLIFEEKHPLLLKLIEEFTANFDGNAWGHNGPYMLSRVVMRLAFNDTSYKFNIMSPTAFYPVDWTRIPKYFKHPDNRNETQWTYDEDYRLKKISYAVHLWNQYSRNLKIERQSLVGRLISDHCIICKDIYDTDPSSISTSL